MSEQMSQEQLDPIQEIYSSIVKAKYQSSERMRGIMPEVSNNGGGVRHDWVGTELGMTEVPFGASEIQSNRVDFTPVITKPLRLVVKTAIAEADQSLTNVALQQAHASMHGKAAARQVDILKLRAIFENPNLPLSEFTTIANTVGPNTGLNSNKLSAMATALNNEDVDMGNRSVIANSDQFDTLMLDERYNNFFYNTDKTLPGYELKMFAGLNPYMLGKNSKNSIPVTTGASNETNSYAAAIHFEAMQFMFNLPMRTVISYDQQNLNYVIITEIVANAQVIQKEGIALASLQLDSTGQPAINPEGA